jgi:hypothetical protein
METTDLSRRIVARRVCLIEAMTGSLSCPGVGVAGRLLTCWVVIYRALVVFVRGAPVVV